MWRDVLIRRKRFKWVFVGISMAFILFLLAYYIYDGMVVPTGIRGKVRIIHGNSFASLSIGFFHSFQKRCPGIYF
jgi:hypothetical protein